MPRLRQDMRIRLWNHGLLRRVKRIVRSIDTVFIESQKGGIVCGFGGICLCVIGWIMLFFSALIPIPFYRENDSVIGAAGGILCMIQCVVLLVSIFPTEKALKRNFTDDGMRR